MADLSTPYSGVLATNVVGSMKVRVRSIQTNLQIVANEAESASRHVFYPMKTITTFGLVIEFPSYESRERFNDWMDSFMDRVLSTRSNSGALLTMLVIVPSREFSKEAVPLGPISHGDGVTDTALQTQIGFAVTKDAIERPLASKDVSHFQMPRRGGKARFFYPAGQQLSGTAGLASAIYDDVVDGWEVGGGLDTPQPQPDATPPGFSGETEAY